MKLETYRKSRELFLSRYNPNECYGSSYIEPMLKGIYNKSLFFKIFSVDYKLTVSMVTYILDKYKRYYTARGEVGSRIRIFNHPSVIDKYQNYDKVLKYCMGATQK